MPARIPLSVPTLAGNEARYLAECVTTGWVASGGPFVRRFEEQFVRVTGARGAVSVASGTTALHLALVELDIGPGDEVVVPSLTFIATANPVRYVGATPIFADVDPVTYTLDPASAHSVISERTRAIVPVHLYGHPADLDALRAVAEPRGIAIVEDSTEALGSLYRGAHCGTVGDVGAFSFNGNKVITAGGGGMLVADQERLDHLRHLSLQARVQGTTEYLHDEVGYNATLSNLQAAVGLAQLERLRDLVAARRGLARRYRDALGEVDDLRFCAEAEWASSNFWLMSVIVDERVSGRSRETLARDLGGAGIDSRPFFHPLQQLPPYREFATVDTPVASELHARGLSLPSSASLSVAEQDRVIAVLRR